MIFFGIVFLIMEVVTAKQMKILRLRDRFPRIIMFQSFAWFFAWGNADFSKSNEQALSLLVAAFVSFGSYFMKSIWEKLEQKCLPASGSVVLITFYIALGILHEVLVQVRIATRQ